MPAKTLNRTPDSLHGALRLWLIDDGTLEILRTVRPHLRAALDGQAEDLLAAFGTDPEVAAFLADQEVRRKTIRNLAEFWQTIVADGITEATKAKATALGREHFRLGLDSGHFLLASQRVLRHLVGAIIAIDMPDKTRVIDAVTRLVMLTDDLALTAYFGSVANRDSELEVRRRTEELCEQMRVLEELAHVDGLTKLFNRRHFDQALVSELDRSARHGAPLSLLLADIDHFKRVNDDYGHRVGDSMLCRIADILNGAARRSDVLARYGGEEFALILPNTGADRASVAAERLREAVEHDIMAVEGADPVSVTISVGIAVLAGDESAEELVHRADLALYRAKAQGRNKVAS